jgi:SAM-dependent methyltransferase
VCVAEAAAESWETFGDAAASLMSTLKQMQPGAPPVERGGPLDVWAAGVGVGLRTLRKEPVLGLKRLALPVSYWRSAEFGYVWRQLNLPAGARVLDVGSPKDLAVMLAYRRGYEVVATDILPEAIESSRRYAAAQSLDGIGPGRVRSEVQDGRALEYVDDSFDAAFSVSVLEHIPDDGDSQAMGELMRVVRPGGTIVITVPYDRQYRETFVDGRVYERTPVANERLFFERHYDRHTLAARLLRAGGGDVIDLTLWGEGSIRFEALLDRLGPLRIPLSPLEAIFSMALLRPLRTDDCGHPMAAFVTVRPRG